MKKIAIILLVIIGVIFAMIMTSCNTYKKQLGKFNNFADAHPDALAVKCVEKFPVTQHDGPTVTTVDSTHKANNKDYKPQLDSVVKSADSLKNKLLQLQNSKTDPCSSVAQFYLPQVIMLTAKLNNLQSQYKQCQSDTSYRTRTHTVYQVDSARAVMWHNTANKYRDSLKNVQGQLVNEKATAASRLKWIFILGGIIALSILGTVLKILGKI